MKEHNNQGGFLRLRTLTLSGVALITAVSLGLGGAGVAGASTVPAGGWVSTQTSPEYILANDGPTVAYTPGTTTFSATWNPKFGVSWQDTYFVTGYSQGENSSAQAGAYGKYVYYMPIRVIAPVRVSGSMTYTTSPDFDGRAGWDIWLSPAGSETTDTSATALEQNPKTVEILLQSGGKSFYDTAPEGYERFFYGVGSLSNVDIGWYTAKALSTLGLNPANYYWVAIDGGAEMVHGTFSLDSYALSVTTQVIRDGKTVTVPVMGEPLSTIRLPEKAQKAHAKVTKPVASPTTTVVHGKLALAAAVNHGRSLLWLYVLLGVLTVCGLILFEVWQHRRPQR